MIGSRLWQIAGWTMLHYLWVGAALGAVALLLRPALRSATANARYLFALGSLLLLSISPVAIAAVVMQSIAPLPQAEPRPMDFAGQPEAVSREEARPVSSAHGPWVQAVAAEAPRAQSSERLLAALNLAAMCLPWLWVCGAPLSFLLTTAGLLGAERLRRQSRPLEDPRISDMCRQLAASLRIACRVSVAICDRIAVPILVGVVRPMILLPAAALAGWSPQQLEMVLLHELAHVRRYDNLVNLLQRVVESLLFFQPMVWIVSGWVRREREHCCDELVVARTRQPHAYAEVLVTLSERLAQPPLPNSSLVQPQAFSSMAERPLVARIRRILRKEEQAMQVSRKAVVLALGTVLTIAVVIGGYCLPSRAQESSAQVKGPAGAKADAAKPAVAGDVIEGVVVDEQGESQPGIDVWTVDWHGTRSTTRSGADGRFRLVFREPLIGEFNLLATNTGGTRQGIRTGTKLGPAKLPPQQVVLKESRAVEAQVVDGGGLPLGAVPVAIDVVGATACHTVLEPVATDSRGRARLMVPADAQLEWIAAFKAGAGMDYAYFEGDPAKGLSSPVSMKLVLNGAMPVRVRLHDSRGQPVANVRVSPWQLWKKGHVGVFCFRTASVGVLSDAQGRVQFDWLPADLEKWVQFSVDEGDYSYPVQRQLTITDGGDRTLDIELQRPAQIAGKVTHADGKPAPGIMLEAEGMGTGGGRSYARTAEDGTYRLKVLPNNSYIIAVVSDQWAAASLTGIVLKEGEDRKNLDLQLIQGTLIRGRVTVDAESWPKPMEPWQEPTLFQFGPEIPNEWKSSPFAALWGDGPDKYRVRLLRFGNLDAAGRYSFRVGPGEYELHLPGFPPKTQRLTITNQSEVVVDGQYPKLPPLLRGVVVDRAGKPVPLAFVRYMGPPSSHIPTVADKDGRFSLQRYATPGHVYAGSQDANLAGLQAIAEEESQVTIVVDKAATVVGRLVDASGKPLAGMAIQCQCSTPKLPRRSIPVGAKTDKEGRYKFTALVPGWHGEMSFHRFTNNRFVLFEGPKLDIQSGENNLGDTTAKPAPLQ